MSGRNNPYVFRSLVTTMDRRLTKGKDYEGEIISSPKGLRVLIYSDDRWDKMTFDPKVFLEMTTKLIKGWGSNL